MSSVKLNPTRALQVIASDDCNIPTPNLLVEGVVTDNINPLELFDENASFYVTNSSDEREYKVNSGDVVYFYGSGLAATVVEVIDENTLLLNASVPIVDEEYKIYQQSPVTGAQNQGCLLYIGGTTPVGALDVNTIGGERMIVSGVPHGMFNIQVNKVWKNGTTVGEIYALW